MHVPKHNENEIKQAEATEFARFHAHITKEEGEKEEEEKKKKKKSPLGLRYMCQSLQATPSLCTCMKQNLHYQKTQSYSKPKAWPERADKISSLRGHCPFN